MKRDFDIIRSILLQVEAAPAGRPLMQLEFDDAIEGAVVAEHIQLMIQYGLVEGEVMDFDPPCFDIERMTWQGHDFLEKARNETIWRKVLGEAKTNGVALTITILGDLLSKAAAKLAGLP